MVKLIPNPFRIVGLLWLCSLAACSSPLGSPQLEAVTPSRVPDNAASEITLEGRSFQAEVVVRFDDAAVDITTDFEVWLSDGAATVTLTEVRWIDANKVVARVPEGVSPGAWDVTIRANHGGASTLPQGLLVYAVEPEVCQSDVDCIDDDPCTTGERCVEGRCLADSLDLRRYYLDRDGDGFGEDAQWLESCELPDGYAERGGDCDDAPATCGADCHPAKPTDRCDTYDNDCDGEVDEDAPALTWFQDLDSDGFGDDSQTVTACEMPPGFSAVGGDCDDSPASCGQKCAPIPDRLDRCDSFDNDCDGDIDEDPDATQWFQDLDGDGAGDPAQSVFGCEQPAGFVEEGNDCDDDPDACGAACDPAIAQEICDGFDNTCDGEVDEGLSQTWYRDLDGDGAGDATDAQESCVQPTGYVANSTDCDDDPQACGAACSPFTTQEICDGFDNTCDGAVDQGLSQTWYRDLDNDGAGDPEDTQESCVQPTGYVANGTDCDDDPEACGAACSPFITQEICDGFDNDCNDNVDDGAKPTVWFRDADGDGHGDGADTVTACVAPTGYIATGGDCDDDPAGCGADCHPGLTVESCDGFDNDCDPTTVDGSGEPDFATPCDGPDVDQCANGLFKCGFGQMQCSEDDNGSAVSESEADKNCSDGIDNDCDGDTDALDSGCLTSQSKPGDLPNKSSTSHDGGLDRSQHTGSTHRFSGLTPFSVALWCKRTQGSFLAQTIVAAREDTSAQRGWWMTWKSGDTGYIELRLQAGSSDAVAARTVAGEVPNDDEWHFVVATYDGSSTAAGIQVYVDGAAAPMNPTSDTFTGPLSPDLEFSIGAWGDLFVGEWEGYIDETSLWSVALSPQDIALLYNDGVPVSPQDASAAISLLSWWRHGDDNGADDSVMVDQIGDNPGTLMSDMGFVNEFPGSLAP